MSTYALPVSASPPPALAAEIARARLSRQPFPPEATLGIPYYDDEFDMAQSTAHSATIRDLGPFLDRLADWTSLRVLSDNPVWYWVHEDEQQRILYPDYALADTPTPERALAADLRLALEVVSTERPEKERKDSERMRERNAANGVPEFGLLYPEPEDARALRWFQLDAASGLYREAALPAERRFRSQAVPGLELEVLEATAWRPGRKVRLWYRGARIPSAEEEARRADQEARRAEEETRRAHQESLRADQESRRADAAETENARLLALLRQAGVVSE
ncbi:MULTISPECIES: hypothetical protein [unclassified Thiocapsa]|uniref:hypothetical protein n=1 Tax=unclassified Thiocapsa TaxID=2641286 RepID=UPI0035B2F262